MIQEWQRLVRLMKKKRVLHLSDLAQKLGYLRSSHPEFKKAVELAQNKGHIKVFRSGFKSDSHHHEKVAYAVTLDD